MSPHFLFYLIKKIKTVFLAHFYPKKYKIKTGSGNELQPSKILYIGSSKRLNNYYAHKV
jgi:hypothetical protein